MRTSVVRPRHLERSTGDCMTQTRPRAAILAAIVLLVGACAGSAASPPTTGGGPESPASSGASVLAPGGTAPAPIAPTDSSGTPAVSPGSPAVSLTQPWATATLTDVGTGEAFRIADLGGKVVIVEMIAIWCSNCRAQQGDVQLALARLPADKVVYVVLDVDPNEDAASLAEYRVANGFEGRYAIAGPDVARALAADFGDQVLNPPSTPIVIIGADGTVTPTDYGHKSADEIVALAQAHGA
jgi:thiol-disulfide isomerase/thioredoxin